MRPSLSVVLALSAGVLGGTHPLLGAALLLSSGALLWLELRTPASKGWALLALVGVAAAGWHAAVQGLTGKLPLDERRRFRGIVSEDPTQTIGGTHVLLDVTAMASAPPAPWEPRRGKVLLRVEGDRNAAVGRGDVVTFRGSLRTPTGLRNPGSTGLSSYLERKGVHARAHAAQPGAVASARPGLGTPAWLRWRRDKADAIRAAAPGQPGAVLAALTLGDWSGVSPETSTSFRLAGTTHLLAISGLHLGILAMLMLPAIRWGLLRVPRLAHAFPVEPIARVLVLPVVAGYAFLSGLQTSTLRSLAMTALYIVAGTLSRPMTSLGGLTAAVAVLGVTSPLVLLDPGLHLSAAALAGLFWLAPRIEARLQGLEKPVDLLAPPQGPAGRVSGQVGRWALRIAVAGVAAAAATAPISAFHFGSSSLLGLALNPAAVPWVEFFCLPMALAGTLVHGLWSNAGEALWRLSAFGLEALLRVQDALGPKTPLLSHPALETGIGCAGAMALLVAAGLALEKPIRSTRTLLFALLGVAGLCGPLAASWATSRFDPRGHLWVLDVGNGQALVVKLPPDRWLLVDGGGFPGSSFDPGERVVVPALQKLGARRLWLAVSSHPHPDHLSGLPATLKSMPTERLWLPDSFRDDDRYDAVLEAAQIGKTAVEWIGPAGAPRRERAGETTVEAVWVPGPTENDRSLVLRLATGRTKLLLPADLEAAGQAAYLKLGFSPSCDLLVAPHHGSAGAVHEPFLEAAHPSFVLISASGRSSLPSERFLAAASNVSAHTYATSEIGCLHAIFDRRGVTVIPASSE